ncbi:hypothetical protein ACFY2K_30470 [Kitasatospora sp. NPDC001309]|uniref:hypothetical protein n=1 Tax=Kitasatospora sp. NPDC001309 TaxID=3364013 RepID=UPI00367D93FB
MSTHNAHTHEEDDAPRDDGTVRERSAEERSITAPTPKDVRAKADDADKDAEEDGVPEPPAAGTQAP